MAYCCLVHTPMVHMASGRRQIILSVKAEGDLQGIKNPDEQAQAVLVPNTAPLLLDDIVDGMSFDGVLSFRQRYGFRP